MSLISSQLDRVTGYPADAEQPRLSTFGNEDEPIVSYIITRSAGNLTPMLNFGEFLTEVVGERIERVPGVSGIDIFGDTARQMRSATVSAPAKCVLGSTSRNSSPP